VELLPDYVTFDAMAKYAMSDNVDIQLNVYNVLNKYYFDMAHFAFATPGAGRSAMLTLNYHS
jgi:catecholate siderophore receptor